MKTIKWINPFTGKDQNVSINEHLINNDGTLKVPEILNADLQEAFSLAIDGCLEAAYEGNQEAMRHLMYYLLRLLNDDGKYSSRKFDLTSIRRSLKQDNRSIKDYFVNMHRGIKEKNRLIDPHVTYGQQIANIIFDPTHEKGLPKRGQLELTPTEFDIIFNKVTVAYSETHGVIKDENAQLRNFRARLKSKDCLGSKFETLRDEATIYESFFHHKVAKSFLDAALKKKLYSSLNLEIYTFLHFEQESSSCIQSPLRYVPPLASLKIYHVINKTYEEVFKKSFQHDLAQSIYKKLNGDKSEYDTLLLSIAGILKWYLSDYLNLIRSLKADKIHDLGTADLISKEEIRVEKRLKTLKTFSSSMTSEEMLKRLENLTNKQRECFNLHIEGRSLEEMSSLLEISKDSVRDRLKGALKKLKG